MGVHVIVALVIGFVSVEVAQMSRSLFAILLGLGVLYVTGFVVQRMTGKKGIKWWFANGIAMYLFFWLISWILFYNLAIA
ncbi:MAG: hypothetical protein DRO99_04935 [Candidatus Aenigmatarchaeota archaeon]|nr:MAG: hypothetical protein DRO99_04935 [Candidatus Aenigmarchaeota archaeon]